MCLMKKRPVPLCFFRGKLTVFTVLCEQYQPSLKRDPMYNEVSVKKSGVSAHESCIKANFSDGTVARHVCHMHNGWIIMSPTCCCGIFHRVAFLFHVFWSLGFRLICQHLSRRACFGRWHQSRRLLLISFQSPDSAVIVSVLLFSCSFSVAF